MVYGCTVEVSENSFDSFTKLKIFIFLVSCIISIFFKNTWVAVITLGCFILVDQRFIIPAILIFPVIENILLVKEGITITKITVILLVATFLLDLAKKRKIVCDKKMISLFVFFFVVFYGFFNSIYFADNPFVLLNYTSIIFENIIIYIPRILFVILLYQFLVKKELSFLKQSFQISKWVISFFLIIILVYFSTVGSRKEVWWHLTRLTLESTDPNEFSCMLIALSVFPQYMLFKSKSKMDFICGLISLLATFYIVLQTLSKGGFLTLIFSFVLCLVLFFRKNKTRAIFVLFNFIIIILVLSYIGMFDFNPMWERFFGRYINNISQLTTHRLDYWKVALNASKDKLLLGYGGTSLNARWLTFEFYRQENVLHNLYIDILIAYGLVGIISFATIIYDIFKDFSYLTKNIYNSSNKSRNEDDIFLVTYISLAVMLFAGLALSWLWRELIWFYIGICLSIGTAWKNYDKSLSLRDNNSQK